MIHGHSPLPAITRPASLRQLHLDGASAAAGVHGIIIDADDVTLDQVTVTNFSGDGIVANGDRAYIAFGESSGNRNGVRIEGEGTSVYSMRLSSNQQYAIRITPAATQSVVGAPHQECPILCPQMPEGNEVIGNAAGGIRVEGTANVIDSNDAGDAQWTAHLASQPVTNIFAVANR